MKITFKIIIFGAIFFLVAFCAFLVIKPQTTNAQLASACIFNTTQRCVGKSVFWYDSCGRQQDWVKDCSYQCQNGQCIKKQPVYTKHFKTNCSDNNLYWYDSNGTINDIYKNCSDNNDCTKDSCLNGQCINEGDCSQPIITPVVPPTAKIDTSIFCGIGEDFSKNITVNADQTIDCFIVAKNISADSTDDVQIRTDIPAEIIGVSEIKIDGIVFAGNITSGINIGSFSPNISKLITFSGKTISPITQASTKQITEIVNSNNLSSSDSVAINFQPTIAETSTATVSANSSPFLDFFKRWYIWIFVAIVLIFLFFVIFRRFSSNV
jgi:hypothetical protein